VSSGERQGTAIPRTTWNDTKVIVMDVPRASYDAQAEVRCGAFISRAFICVAHRLDTIIKLFVPEPLREHVTRFWLWTLAKLCSMAHRPSWPAIFTEMLGAAAVEERE